MLGVHATMAIVVLVPFVFIGGGFFLLLWLESRGQKSRPEV
jgi:hypothetical protein